MPLFLPSFDTRLRHEVLLIPAGIQLYQVGEIFVPESMQIYHNGRRLKQATDKTPLTGEYFMTESGGLGTGFDTINLIGFVPRVTSLLFADYFVP